MTEATPVLMDTMKIRETIPHRFPFLLVDRVLEMSIENRTLVAIKNVTANEQHFVGHYPNQPVMPGVLIIEAMAQAACILLLAQPEYAGKTPYFAGIDEARFRRVVVPGDQLRIEVQVTKLKSRLGKTNVRCTVDGHVAAEAVLTCMLGDAPEKQG